MILLANVCMAVFFTMGTLGIVVLQHKNKIETRIENLKNNNMYNDTTQYEVTNGRRSAESRD